MSKPHGDFFCLSCLHSFVIQELIKMETKLQKIYLTYYSLLIAQNLIQVHYQILSVIALKEFIKVNVNTEMMIRNIKLAKFNKNFVTAFLNTQTLMT